MSLKASGKRPPGPAVQSNKSARESTHKELVSAAHCNAACQLSMHAADVTEFREGLCGHSCLLRAPPFGAWPPRRRIVIACAHTRAETGRRNQRLGRRRRSQKFRIRRPKFPIPTPGQAIQHVQHEPDEPQYRASRIWAWAGGQQ